MLSQSAQSLESKDIVLNKIEPVNAGNLKTLWLNKIKSLRVEELKAYLGIAYFVLVSLLSISLFF